MANWFVIGIYMKCVILIKNLCLLWHCSSIILLCCYIHRVPTDLRVSLSLVVVVVVPQLKSIVIVQVCVQFCGCLNECESASACMIVR